MARKMKDRSVAEIIIRSGFLNLRRSVKYAAKYSKACDKAGRLLTLQEYWEATGLSRAQAYREQDAWRKCFGDDTLLEVVTKEAIRSKGWSLQEREAAILRWFDGGRWRDGEV
jgi:hypothetical protein